MKQEKLCEFEDMAAEELGVENGRLRQQLRELDALQTFPEKPRVKAANTRQVAGQRSEEHTSELQSH